MNILARSVICALVMGLLYGSPCGASVTILFADTWASMSTDVAGEYYSDNSNSTSGATTTTALPDRGYLSTTASVYDNGGFAVLFEQTRPSGYGLTHGESTVSFTVDIDTTYTMAGSFFTLADQNFFAAELFDHTLNESVFFQASQNYSMSHFNSVLGVQDANLGSAMSGSLSGALFAGHEYTWYVLASFSHYVNRGAGGVANGSAHLRFGDPGQEIVPEPASVAVWSCLGIAAVGQAALRKRRNVTAP